MLNALSFDVEDYFHVAAFDGVIDRASWRSRESRIRANTETTLAVLASAGVRATFYVLGWSAEQDPGLVRCIAAAGHEVACHGWSHEVVYRQTPKEFREETRRAKALLEDQSGHAVSSYRAASFSITSQSLWALEILHEEGFRTDSSVFPIHHDRYGLRGGPLGPYRIPLPNGGELVEFPMSALRFGRVAVPVSGGGYFRVYPYWLSRALCRRVNREGRPLMFYLHPWELDPAQPRIQAGLLSRMRHYVNLHRTRPRLTRMLQDFQFASVREVLEEQASAAPLPAHAYVAGVTGRTAPVVVGAR